MKYAGRDATQAYEPIHPPDALEKHLPLSKHLGSLTADAMQTIMLGLRAKEQTKDEIRVETARKLRPPLSRILSLADMEVCVSLSACLQLNILCRASRDKYFLTQHYRIILLRLTVKYVRPLAPKVIAHHERSNLQRLQRMLARFQDSFFLLA